MRDSFKARELQHIMEEEADRAEIGPIENALNVPGAVALMNRAESIYRRSTFVADDLKALIDKWSLTYIEKALIAYKDAAMHLVEVKRDLPERSAISKTSHQAWPKCKQQILPAPTKRAL